MSTKTLTPWPGMDPGGGRETGHLILFIVISLVLHLGIMAAVRAYAPERTPADRPVPIVVDVVELPGTGPADPKEAVIDKEVVALPDAPVDASPVPKRPDFYSDRDQSVVKQTVPGAVVPGPADPDQVLAPVPPTPPAVTPTAEQAVKPAPERSPERSEDRAERPDEPSKKASASEEGPEGRKVVEDSVGPDGYMEAAPSGEAEGGQGKAVDGAAYTARQGVGAGAPAADADTDHVRLFPSEQRLAELAEKYRISSPRGEVGKTLQLNTAELKYQKYTLALKPIIELRMGSSDLVRRSDWQGVAYIDFTINRDGTLDKVIIRKSSGIPALDDDAVTALRLAEPFPPFPDHFLVEKITIKGKFEYLR